MGLLDELADWIVASNLATGYGVDLFGDYTPDDPDVLSALYEYDSVSSPVRGSDAYIRYVQITSRDIDPDAARAKSVQLHALFARKDDDEDIMNLPSGRWVILFPKNLPIKISVDENQRITYGFNVAITTNSD
jgi:hypothetical protein